MNGGGIGDLSSVRCVTTSYSEEGGSVDQRLPHVCDHTTQGKNFHKKRTTGGRNGAPRDTLYTFVLPERRGEREGKDCVPPVGTTQQLLQQSGTATCTKDREKYKS